MRVLTLGLGEGERGVGGEHFLITEIRMSYPKQCTILQVRVTLEVPDFMRIHLQACRTRRLGVARKKVKNNDMGKIVIFFS